MTHPQEASNATARRASARRSSLKLSPTSNGTAGTAKNATDKKKSKARLHRVQQLQSLARADCAARRPNVRGERVVVFALN